MGPLHEFYTASDEHAGPGNKARLYTLSFRSAVNRGGYIYAGYG